MASIGGNAGNNSLAGTVSADSMWGGAGNDTLYGALAGDWLFGGPITADVFVL